MTRRRGFFGVLWTLLLVLAWLFFGCATPRIGPFVPADPTPCSYDGDCPRGHECRFPGVDTHAVCMPAPAGVEFPFSE